MTIPEKTLRSPAALVAAGFVQSDQAEELSAVSDRYAVALPPALAALIDRGDAADPIARQFIPHAAELDHTADELADPIGDGRHSPVPGIVHRYPDRVLLVLLLACPVYCRFCFRRERVGPGVDAVLPPAKVDAALDYIAARPAIREVILTGGDPLMLSPRRIAAVMERLAMLDHVGVVRFHTRVPVATPDAVTPELIDALRASGKTTYVALHANHPRELSRSARQACARLIQAGIAMLGQTVLLRGVNDDPEVLADLMRLFVEMRIRPYYLHHPDLAPGTSRFRLTIEEGRRIVEKLRGRVSGLCQPTYVLDIPGGYGKVPIGPAYVTDDGWIRDPWGELHRYPPAAR